MPQPLVGAVMHLQAAGSATQHARFAIVCKRHLALNAPCDRAHVVGVGGRVAAAGHSRSVKLLCTPCKNTCVFWYTAAASSALLNVPSLISAT